MKQTIRVQAPSILANQSLAWGNQHIQAQRESTQTSKLGSSSVEGAASAKRGSSSSNRAEPCEPALLKRKLHGQPFGIFLWGFLGSIQQPPAIQQKMLSTGVLEPCKNMQNRAHFNHFSPNHMEDPFGPQDVGKPKNMELLISRAEMCKLTAQSRKKHATYD